ncbi:uncharacterized protein BYT42DRAFT_515580 [Radiomyces spectabilis]|uniref:uncharacterized protein n=1 Tax=Radiomyces spectabilis TaxID=64574 RepID=UPI00221EB72D|nr:uncharacterized protein BYT42DRAFT_515580 [Radiomyces spectabilis]KAI8377515.1 hypothetical protein BYT42DRAFT_515580 [Radiomyces spectabilis]
MTLYDDAASSTEGSSVQKEFKPKRSSLGYSKMKPHFARDYQGSPEYVRYAEPLPPYPANLPYSPIYFPPPPMYYPPYNNNSIHHPLTSLKHSESPLRDDEQDDLEIIMHNEDTTPAVLHRASPRENGSISDFNLRKQLEYYFSRQNLANDAYLVSQMDADLYVPIATIAKFKRVRDWTTDIDVVVKTLQESTAVIVDETGTKVKPNISLQRTTVILRDIPEATEEEISDLLRELNSPPVKTIKQDVGNMWYITFESEEDALKILFDIRGKTFKDQPIAARMKSEPVLRSIQTKKSSSTDLESQTSHSDMSSSPSVNPQADTVSSSSTTTNHIGAAIDHSNSTLPPGSFGFYYSYGAPYGNKWSSQVPNTIPYPGHSYESAPSLRYPFTHYPRGWKMRSKHMNHVHQHSPGPNTRNGWQHSPIAQGATMKDKALPHEMSQLSIHDSPATSNNDASLKMTNTVPRHSHRNNKFSKDRKSQSPYGGEKRNDNRSAHLHQHKSATSDQGRRRESAGSNAMNATRGKKRPDKRRKGRSKDSGQLPPPPPDLRLANFPPLPTGASCNKSKDTLSLSDDRNSANGTNGTDGTNSANGATVMNGTMGGAHKRSTADIVKGTVTSSPWSKQKPSPYNTIETVDKQEKISQKSDSVVKEKHKEKEEEVDAFPSLCNAIPIKSSPFSYADMLKKAHDGPAS